MPRAAVISPQIIVETLKDLRFIDDEGNLLPWSNDVWQTATNAMNGKMSKDYLYLYLSQNRNCVLNQIHGIEMLEQTKYDSNVEKTDDDSRQDPNCSIGETKCLLPAIRNNIAISKSEWAALKSRVVEYKKRKYEVLVVGWTDTLYDILWTHMKLPCAFSFKNAKINRDPGETFLSVKGFCSECGSTIHIYCQSEPIDDGTTLHVSTFDSRGVVHHKKRQISGERRLRIGKVLQAKSTYAWRREEANRLMEFGDVIPANLPSEEVVRKAKQEARDKDLGLFKINSVLASVWDMKYGLEFSGSIHEIGLDKFYVMYWTPTQLYMYNKFMKEDGVGSISIDATGSLLKQIPKPDGSKRVIYLYQAVCGYRRKILPLFQLISEKHDTNTLTYWIREWLRCGGSCPKQVVTDYSLALLNATSLAFNNTDLKTYIETCIALDINGSSVRVNTPRCIIRLDISHFINMVARWSCFTRESPQKKDFFMRCVGLLTTCTKINDFIRLCTDVLTIAFATHEDIDDQESHCFSAQKRVSERLKTYHLPDNVAENLDEKESLLERFNDLDVETELDSSATIESHLWDEFELEDATYAECSYNTHHSFQVITASRCLVLCADSRGEMEAWASALRGALHRGADVADLVASLSTGDHHWYAATHARPTFCNVCREPLGALGTAHALACELCKYKAHKRCAARAPPSCKWSTLASLGPHLVEDPDGNIIMPHQWLEGNLPVAAKCDACDKTCGSVLRLQDFRCIWCRKCVHASCRPSWRAPCSLGPARASVVPPTRLHSVGPDDGWLPDRPPNASPLIVFVNSRSGDNQGVKFLRRFKQLLNPAQVFELSGAGPRLGLRLFRHFAPLRVLVCSGDGSVGWVLQEVDKLDMHRQVQTAVLPLGTGNDLARVLGWGASCDDAANLQQLLERYERASTKMLDRWSIMTFERALPAPSAPPDLHEETALLRNLQEIVQAGECGEGSCPSARSSLRAGCARLAAAGESAGGGAARAAHRLRRALSLLLHARTHLAHDHARCDSWEPMDASDSEPEAPPVAEKGSIEKTEKEQLNWAARGCALAGRADSVRRALRSLVRTLALLQPAQAGGGSEGALPVPRAFADSRRSSAASAVSAASMQPDNIPDVDEDIAKLISSNSPDVDNLDVDKRERSKTSSISPRLSPSLLSSCDTSSCKNLLRPDVERTSGTYNSSSLTIPNLVISDDSDKRDSLIQGETYESDQLTIIDIDKPYTDDVHFHDISDRTTPVSGECTPERKLSAEDLEIDATSSEGSNISDDFSLISEIIDTKPEDIDDGGGIGHIDSPEASETTYMNSETIHGESMMDDISSMLGQEVLLAMMGKNGENETYTDDTTLFTSDTVSDIPMDSRHPSLEKKNDAKMKYISKIKIPSETNVEKFGYENRVFYIENAAKAEEQIKYCSLAHFEEGSDIARKSFRKQLRKSIKKRVADDSCLKHLLPKTTGELLRKEEIANVHDSPKSRTIHLEDKKPELKRQMPAFPQVSVVVEPPSPSHSEDRSLKNCQSRMASVLSDIFEGTDTLSVHSPEPTLRDRERRQSDNPKLLGSDPEYGQFLSCSPAATRRISCGSLFKPGEPDKLSTSVSSIWGEGGTIGGSITKSDTSDRAKKLPIINPLVQLPAWPHVTQGFISQCLLANADALCAAVSPLMDPDDTLLEGFYERAVMNNYFGIGIDAKITLDFHNKREEHPEKCRSRARNYMWYGVLGSKEWVNRTYRHLGQRVQLECDGQRIPLPELQGIVVLNISSFMGGTNFWGGTRGDDLFLAPSFDDRILEVVAVFGSAQMAASRLINLQKHRIAQCRAVQINILGDEGVPVQVDGEAWLQPPGCVRIIHRNRAQMLCRSRALETSLRAWDEKLQRKASSQGPTRALAPAEAAHLLVLLDDINTMVKHVKLSCISNDGDSAALSVARRVSAQADALQDAEGHLLPPPQLRRMLATLVESCHELLEGGAGGAGGAAAGALRAALARCALTDGLAYINAEEAPKRAGSRWLRGRRSASEGGAPGGHAGAPPGSAPGTHARAWGVREVQAWLESLDLAEYSEAFAKHDVTGRELLSLARRDLRDLGVTKVGHVKRILQAVKELQ